jgi:sugar lactone lactonase YvrE
MNRFFYGCIALFILGNIYAHPGIGLVYDGQRYIYYTDLTHVWRLDTETGEKQIAIENVHTHELHLDKDGNLFGEHYWYVESEQKFKNYIWKLDKDGNFNKIRDDLDGENTDFGFIRDKDFRSYRIKEVDELYRIERSDSMTTEVLFSGELKHPGWKYLSSDNTLYFVDYPTIYAFKESELIILAEDISARRFPFSIQSNDHDIYGIWTDESDNIFVAIYGGRMVKSINPEGKIESVLKTSMFWSPINGVFDSEGNLWLMESRLNGKIRVRQIDRNEFYQNNSFFFENLFWIILLSIPVVYLIWRIRAKKLQKKRNKFVVDTA